MLIYILEYDILDGNRFFFFFFFFFFENIMQFHRVPCDKNVTEILVVTKIQQRDKWREYTLCFRNWQLQKNFFSWSIIGSNLIRPQPLLNCATCQNAQCTRKAKLSTF